MQPSPLRTPAKPKRHECRAHSLPCRTKELTDKKRRQILASLRATQKKFLPQKNTEEVAAATMYSRDQFAHVRLMQVVENNPLQQGNTFEHKETMMIRIGEEERRVEPAEGGEGGTGNNNFAIRGQSSPLSLSFCFQGEGRGGVGCWDQSVS